MKSISKLVLASMLATLTACGGGSGSGSSVNTDLTPVDVNEVIKETTLTTADDKTVSIKDLVLTEGDTYQDKDGNTKNRSEFTFKVGDDNKIESINYHWVDVDYKDGKFEVKDEGDTEFKKFNTNSNGELVAVSDEQKDDFDVVWNEEEQDWDDDVKEGDTNTVKAHATSKETIVLDNLDLTYGKIGYFRNDMNWRVDSNAHKNSGSETEFGTLVGAYKDFQKDVEEKTTFEGRTYANLWSRAKANEDSKEDIVTGDVRYTIDPTKHTESFGVKFDNWYDIERDEQGKVSFKEGDNYQEKENFVLDESREFGSKWVNADTYGKDSAEEAFGRYRFDQIDQIDNEDVGVSIEGVFGAKAKAE